jgi:hypothetical protein
VEEPGNPQRLWLRTTYGLVTSADRGKSWGYVCEKVIGYSGELDPGIGVTQGGRVLVALPDGLVASTDAACNFTRAPELEGRGMADVSVERDDPTRAVALESTEVSGQFTTRVHRSTDAGATWQPYGEPLPEAVLGLTLDVAPANPMRIYVSGLVSDPGDGGAPATTVGAVFASADAGQSWSRHDVPGSQYESPPYIAAMHPTDPERFYVRVYGASDPELPDFPEDRLLFTDDGGATFVEILKRPSRLLGFALSPDGSGVYAGYGNPYDTFQADKDTFGLYVASANDHVFSHVYAGHIGCLAWGAGGFYECTEQDETGFELGVAPDPMQAFEPLLTTQQIQPAACHADTCANDWSFLCVRLGLCASDAGADGGTAPGDASVEPGSASGEDGCGCGTSGMGAHSALVLVALFVLGAGRRLLGRAPAF